jgi:hypothetical protein
VGCVLETCQLFGVGDIVQCAFKLRAKLCLILMFQALSSLTTKIIDS